MVYGVVSSTSNKNSMTRISATNNPFTSCDFEGVNRQDVNCILNDPSLISHLNRDFYVSSSSLCGYIIKKANRKAIFGGTQYHKRYFIINFTLNCISWMHTKESHSSSHSIPFRHILNAEVLHYELSCPLIEIHFHTLERHLVILANLSQKTDWIESIRKSLVISFDERHMQIPQHLAQRNVEIEYISTSAGVTPLQSPRNHPKNPGNVEMTELINALSKIPIPSESSEYFSKQKLLFNDDVVFKKSEITQEPSFFTTLSESFLSSTPVAANSFKIRIATQPTSSDDFSNEDDWCSLDEAGGYNEYGRKTIMSNHLISGQSFNSSISNLIFGSPQNSPHKNDNNHLLATQEIQPLQMQNPIVKASVKPLAMFLPLFPSQVPTTKKLNKRV